MLNLDKKWGEVAGSVIKIFPGIENICFVKFKYSLCSLFVVVIQIALKITA